MNYQPGAAALGRQVSDAIMARSVQQFLEPGEELVFCDERAARSVLGPLVVSFFASPEPEGMTRKVTIAVTDRRFLLLSVHIGAMNEANGVIAEAALSEVGDVQVRKRWFVTSIVSWTARGTAYTAKVGTIERDRLAAALQPR